MVSYSSGPTCLCGVAGAAECPVHPRPALEWLGAPVEPVPRPKRRATKAEVMDERKERAKLAEEDKAQPGTCPKCGTPVLFARHMGFMYVCDAIPVRYDSTWQSYVKDRYWGHFAVVRGLLKPVMHHSDVKMYGLEYVHLEHDSCGKVIPRLAEIPKPPKEDSDVPPFEDDFRKPWRCWDCREVIPPERQAVVISYNGPDISYYYCHCDQQCQPVNSTGQLGTRKVKYPKINPRTMKYEAPKKGEVLPE